MIMLFERDTDWGSVPEEALDEALAEHGRFTTMLRERGIDYYGEAVKDSREAVTLRPSGDGLAASDGPFAQQEAQLSGFYVVDVKDLDEAVEIARQCPTAAGTEVRPIWESAA
ncbi:YciI family protein [Plantactinospora mayteni]|nr:YciI family protein [Plantactinospora mayteni]